MVVISGTAIALGLAGIFAGTALGAGVGALFGGDSKKEATIAQQVPTGLTIEPYGVYAPQPTFQKSVDIILESPYAETGAKKFVSEPTAPYMPITQRPSASAAQEQSEGINFTTIAIVAAIGLVGYGLVAKKGD